MQACKFIKKEALAEVFSCKFFKIVKNTFFIKHLRWLLLIFVTSHKCKYIYETMYDTNYSFPYISIILLWYNIKRNFHKVLRINKMRIKRWSKTVLELIMLSVCVETT